MSSLVACPLCGRAFHHKLIEAHAAQCDPTLPITATTSAQAVAQQQKPAAQAVAQQQKPEAQAVAVQQQMSPLEESAESEEEKIAEVIAGAWCRRGNIFTQPEDVCAPERLHSLNSKPVRSGGRYVLLWVQQDVRVPCNHALEYAAAWANKLQLPVVAVYGLMPSFPGANERMFSFLVDGLCNLFEQLRTERRIQLVALPLPPPEAVALLQQEAALVVVDRGYSRICRQWRRLAGAECSCRVDMVETNVVVPVQLVSNHVEPAARTLRPKIHAQLSRFLQPMVGGLVPAERSDTLVLALPDHVVPLPLGDKDAVMALLAASGDPAGPSVPAVAGFKGGHSHATKHLCSFVQRAGGAKLPVTTAGGLWHYATGKGNSPSCPKGSGMSPFLHFGHISPLHIALVVNALVAKCEAAQASAARGCVSSYLEELIVRRELARNMVFFNESGYDSVACLPRWARETLEAHQIDDRAASYTRSQLERGETADECWNAAQWEMVATGHMHNYLRMFWCKKILEWSPDAASGFRIAIELNDKFELDGRDENGYMGVAWCFGHHDQPFPERPIYGKLVHRKCVQAVRAEGKIEALLSPAALAKVIVAPGKKRPPASHDIRGFFSKKSNQSKSKT